MEALPSQPWSNLYVLGDCERMWNEEDKGGAMVTLEKNCADSICVAGVEMSLILDTTLDVIMLKGLPYG